MTGPSPLAAEKLTVSFGALRALEDVSVDVGLHSVVSLIGPNGAGKTTLLNAVSGLHRAEQGRILLHGRDMTAMPANRRSMLGLRRTFQHARLAEELSALENVLSGAPEANYPCALLREWLRRPERLADLRAQRERAFALLASLGLEDVTDAPAWQLSFGRKKLVDLARALMTSPSVLLMDEPTAGLSEAEIETLAVLVKRLRAETSILLVAHHMGFVEKVADRVVCLVAGHVIADGTPQQVQADPKVLSAYMGAA